MKEVLQMTNVELNTALYEKMFAELKRYRAACTEQHRNP